MDDLTVKNLTVTDSATLNGTFLVDTDAVKLGGDLNTTTFKTESIEDLNSKKHKKRDTEVVIDLDNICYKSMDFNKTSTANKVNINSSGDYVSKNLKSINFTKKDKTTNSKVKYVSDTSKVTHKKHNYLQKYKVNGSKMFKQKFGANNAVDKVIYDNANAVSAKIFGESLTEYAVQDNKVFEQKIVEHDGIEFLQLVRVQDAFREQLIIASLKDKRKATNF